MSNAEFAFKLAEAGYAVFRVREDKTPYDTNGLKAASLDPWFVKETFEKTPAALIGIHAGMSGIVVLDLDYKTDDEGNVTVDGQDELDRSWLEVPTSFEYVSISGNGKHIMYRAPENVPLNPKAGYRGMKGVDRRAGESYVVFTATDIPENLTEAPEWLCDVSREPTSVDKFRGTVKDWYSTLEEGEPNVLVRAAMERAEALFAQRGDDLTHSDIVERQHEAVRLGSEGNPGVPQLLELLERLTLERTGDHSRTEDEYEAEFHEALASGISKAGDAIALRKELPEYTPSLVPSAVADRLFMGTPGRKADFTALLRALQDSTDDDLLVTSVLWNSPKTKDMAREWGLEFVHKRVQEARLKPEPIKENPSLPEPSEINVTSVPSEVNVTSDNAFMTAEEVQIAESTPTFIDTYLAASAKKGFNVPAYDIPSAWTALSMTFGTQAVLAYNGLGTNLWFIKMGNTGTGKSQSHAFGKAVMDLSMRDNDSYYNVGASSSPAAIHEELLMRDGKASMIMHDEAASFFSDLANQEWSKTLEHHFSSFYDGEVEPSNKVRLPQELRGKHARTSFGLNMSATPDKLLSLLNTGMFESGFLSRVNWTWTPDRPETDDIFLMRESEVDAHIRTHPAVYDVAADLRTAGAAFTEPVVVRATDEAWARLSKAAKDFYVHSKNKERFETLKGPLTRLRETTAKCAALLALYRGETVFTLRDAIIAIYYASHWYEAMVRVVNETSESDFSRDCNEIESFVRLQGEVSGAKLNHRFRSLIKRSPRELSDRIDFLVDSGRVLADRGSGSTVYRING